VSDRLPELAALFGDAVLTYEQPDELRAAVDLLVSDRAQRRRRGDAGRAAVLDAHTFDHRAATLLRLLHDRELLPGA
jgi:spore maturation protein CgeB